MQRFKSQLTVFELSEVTQFEKIYTIGKYRVRSQADFTKREDNTYRAHVGEQLGYRSVVEEVCGAGAFGQVLKCKDMKDDKNLVVAVKISKATKSDNEMATTEAKFLIKISQNDPDGNGLLKYYDSFSFRRHFFIVTELCGINLYKAIKVQGVAKSTV